MFSLVANRFIITVLPTRRSELRFTKYSSLVIRCISTDSKTDNSFAISYLINTCKLPQHKAISALKTVHFESPENPDAVLTLFRDSGFSNTQISKIIGKLPHLLLCSVHKTLKPKFDFFKSQGISGIDFAQVVCSNPFVLMASLEKRIIPGFELIQSIVHSDAKLLALFKRSASVLRKDPQKNLLPNRALLQQQGVPDDNIARLLVTQPRSFLKPTSRFSEIVEEVKKMKFDPKKYLFLAAIHGLTSMSKSSLEAKFDVYRRWGLSEDELQLMFQKTPYCLMISEKNIMSTMSYFVNEMGYTPSEIAKCPNALLFSLNRRIIPRCSVIQRLKLKGLVENDLKFYQFLVLSEEGFLKKYVTTFEKEVPELLSTYRSKGRGVI